MGCSGSKSPSKRITMLGLDGAGKTCILYALFELMQVGGVLQTIGYNIEQFYVNSKRVSTLSFWDAGGLKQIRALWHNYYEDTGAIIYVIDANTQDRWEESKNELVTITQNTELQEKKSTVPFLILVNKIDLAPSVTTQQIEQAFDLKKILSQFRYNVALCSAKEGEDKGILEALQYIFDEMKLNVTGKQLQGQRRKSKRTKK